MKVPERFMTLLEEYRRASDIAVKALPAAHEAEDIANTAHTEAQNDKTEMGTAAFRTLTDAVKYYDPYGLTSSDVLRKLDEGEIHIRPQLGLDQYFDNDWRIWQRRPGLRAATANLRQAMEARQKVQDAHRDTITWIGRLERIQSIETVYDVTMLFPTQAYLLKVLKGTIGKPWLHKLPYYCGGRICYTSLDYDKEGRKPDNTRMVLLTHKGTEWAIARFRQFGNTTSTHWGMTERPSLCLLFAGSTPVEVSEHRHALVHFSRIIWKGRHE